MNQSGGLSHRARMVALTAAVLAAWPVAHAALAASPPAPEPVRVRPAPVSEDKTLRDPLAQVATALGSGEADASIPRVASAPADALGGSDVTAPADATSAAARSDPLSTVWVADSGSELRETLIAWAERAGWSVVWNSDYDFRLRAGARFTGPFESALKSLLDSVRTAGGQVYLRLYAGNRVVVVRDTWED
ncbi:toxin co-regulated pilus biosynthesis Q family protein [Chitinasiproducens palmae]|uniref:Toxin co-regulated pilus biosynthesis protein Q n=1 Tax=Chitinasiproducens palmae TaxID=1770053 RepID=A0A1H2PLJ4_9BURK|nr:toxin co-regulated pilus biosynthesis Q family protein [Chitinasiproducens palmae]SDV46546.1 Toxin co-regulated pilus biosynthesis protein Q [Chitinasiproducens palmae]